MAIAAGCDLLLVDDDLAAQGRARDALVDRALRDEVFEARLRDAARGVDALRASRPARPAASDGALDAVFARPERAALEARVAALRAGREGHDPTAR